MFAIDILSFRGRASGLLLGESYNGNTLGFDPNNAGSTPASPAKSKTGGHYVGKLSSLRRVQEARACSSS